MRNKKNKHAKFSLILRWVSDLNNQIPKILSKKQKLIQQQERGRKFSAKELEISLLTVKDSK